MEFKEFRKIPRLSRECTITEKLDGTNAQIFIYSSKDKLRFPFSDESNIPSQKFIDDYCVYIHPENPHVDEDDKLYVFAGSKNRWLKIGKNTDNHGFASWVQKNGAELVMLGEGRHYGEFYGKGIQRGYGLEEKRFALFNTGKWVKQAKDSISPLGENQQYCPDCCDVVPILYKGLFLTSAVDNEIDKLIRCGSRAVPGYFNPEGIVVFHEVSGTFFKKTIKNDAKAKGQING
jgi:hypothetical protein